MCAPPLQLRHSHIPVANETRECFLRLLQPNLIHDYSKVTPTVFLGACSWLSVHRIAALEILVHRKDSLLVSTIVLGRLLKMYLIKRGGRFYLTTLALSLKECSFTRCGPFQHVFIKRKALSGHMEYREYIWLKEQLSLPLA